jgi:hypothetical protein
MTPKTQALTELWAKLGYVSFAADIFGYGQGVLPRMSLKCRPRSRSTATTAR